LLLLPSSSFLFSFSSSAPHPALHSFPTRRSSDLPELPTADWIRVLREARALGAVQLGLSGGEPLVREDLEPLVAEAHALGFYIRSEEHTSELQSPYDLVCRLLLEKKKKKVLIETQ